MPEKKSDFTPEVLETIVSRIADRITDSFKTFVEQLVTAITDRVDAKLADLSVHLNSINGRMDNLEKQLNHQPNQVPVHTAMNQAPQRPSTSFSTVAASPVPPQTDTGRGIQVLMAVELEKSERLKRLRNVVVSGLHPEDGKADAELFTNFCEQHLTIKPRPVSTRRVGPRNIAGDVPQKLKVTFSSDTAAEELISASQILRESEDEDAKTVFINRDMTPMEAQLAFEARKRKRQFVSTSGQGHAPSA